MEKPTEEPQVHCPPDNNPPPGRTLDADNTQPKQVDDTGPRQPNSPKPDTNNGNRDKTDHNGTKTKTVSSSPSPGEPLAGSGH